MSSLFLRTLRDDPSDASVASHKLLVRAGYVRPIAAGIFSWLPLGVIALRNVERVRDGSCRFPRSALSCTSA
jgi:prolyl-tRNA synthetase